MFRIIATLVLAAFAFAAHAAVDVNKATQAELETVKGIGPKLSDKILAERQKGAFKDWSDMVVRVGGIGGGNAARFSQAGLTVGGAEYSVAPAQTAKADKPARAPKAAKSESTAAMK